MRYIGRVLIVPFVLSPNIAASRTHAADWPENYVVRENSESPDGQYGILVASMDAWEKDETLEETNYLANLKNHRLMGKIRGADYFEGQNHRGLQVVWSPDSSWCVVEYDGRYGADTISVLEVKDSNFIQTEIGKKVDKELAAALNKKSHDKVEHRGDATTYFRIGADQKLPVRAVSTTDPKELDLKNCHYALFDGTFDLRSKKWLTANARALDREEYKGVETGLTYSETELRDTSFKSPEKKAEWLDERLNEVYTSVRLLLPPNSFAAVKKEQIEWLKKRDAAGSVEEKCKSMEARIKALQELVW